MAAADVPVRGHLDQVDLFRIVTFAAVVAVHSFAFTNPPDSVAANALGMVLHFTREAFFFLTGFVLVHSQRDRPLDLRRFWSRRMRLIGVPYLVWSVFYWAYHLAQAPRPAGLALSDLVWGVLGGHAEFHLYFLLVSMQIYLVFPLLLGLIRAFRRHPWALLGVVGTYQVAVLLWLRAGGHTGFPGWLAAYAYVLLPSYLLWVLLGALAAQHLPRAQGWLLAHQRTVVALSVAAVAVTVAEYFRSVAGGHYSGDSDASAVLQPVMILDSLGIIALLALASCNWAGVRARHPRLLRSLRWGSSASFGVYLVHPLVLDGVLALGLHGPRPALVPQPWAGPLAWALTLCGSVAIVAVLRRTPLSLPLTGRARATASGATARTASGVPADRVPVETA